LPGLGRMAAPVGRRFPGFQHGILFSGIPLGVDWHNRGIKNLAADSMESLNLQSRRELDEERVDHSGLRQSLAEKPDGFRIRDAPREIQPKKAHKG